MYFFDESDTESTQEEVSTSYRSRSLVRVRRLEDLDSQPSQYLLAEPGHQW